MSTVLLELGAVDSPGLAKAASDAFVTDAGVGPFTGQRHLCWAMGTMVRKGLRLTNCRDEANGLVSLRVEGVVVLGESLKATGHHYCAHTLRNGVR